MIDMIGTGVFKWFIAIFLGVALGPAARAQVPDAVQPPWDFPEARQFDFWLGEWRVNNRFIQNDGTWQDDGFAHVRIYSILDGKGVLEFWDGEIRGGTPLRGFSLRYYDAEAQQWMLALNWPAPNRPNFGRLEGAFRHGRGEFFTTSADTAGTETISRYSFSDVSPDALRWDDGYSRDGGLTWRDNWVMEFTRTADEPRWPAPGEAFHTYVDGSRCTAPEAEQFDAIEGRWEGTYTDADGTEGAAHLEAYRVLDGCAVFSLLAYEQDGRTYKAFEIRSFLPGRREWVALRLDNRSGTGYVYEAGRFEEGTIDLVEITGAEGEPDLTKTAWAALDGERLRFERATSGDGGETWNLKGTVNLTRRR
jgi:hypothetical protein